MSLETELDALELKCAVLTIRNERLTRQLAESDLLKEDKEDIERIRRIHYTFGEMLNAYGITDKEIGKDLKEYREQKRAEDASEENALARRMEERVKVAVEMERKECADLAGNQARSENHIQWNYASRAIQMLIEARSTLQRPSSEPVPPSGD